MTELSKNAQVPQCDKTAVMRSAFYTPTLEEFHVGFEYEEYQQKEWNKLISPPKSLGYEWIKKIFNSSTSLGKIKHNVEGINYMDWMIDGVDEGHPTCKIRVKYLGRKDFEDLNFTREFATMSDILKTGCEVYKNEALNVQIAHYKELNKISICTIDFSKNKTKSSWDENQINLIAIKNKSELQYILIRLGFSQADA